MKRILEINIPNEGSDYFPMDLYIVQIPDTFEVDSAWAIPMLKDEHWSEMYDILENAYDKAETTHIKIDNPQPEWAEKGRQLFIDTGNEDDIASEDEQSLAAYYIHNELIKIMGCIGIFSWRW